MNAANFITSGVYVAIASAAVIALFFFSVRGNDKTAMGIIGAISIFALAIIFGLGQYCLVLFAGILGGIMVGSTTAFARSPELIDHFREILSACDNGEERPPAFIIPLCPLGTILGFFAGGGLVYYSIFI